jgi:hypothetical protein
MQLYIHVNVPPLLLLLLLYSDQVAARGYPLERHAAVTPDDYELIVHRIPHGRFW